MALDTSDLVAFANGSKTRRLHYYATNDTLANLVAANYFDSAYKQFAVGDLILCALDLDGTPATQLLAVTAISAAGVVTVAQLNIGT